MPDKKAAEAWQKIHAPQQLRERVMQTAKAPPAAKPVFFTKRRISALTGLAACLLLVSALAFSAMQGGSPTLSVGGTVLTDQPTAVSAMTSREAAPAALGMDNAQVALWVETDDPATLTVSGGTLLTKKTDGTWSAAGTRLTLEHSGTVQWQADAADAPLTLQVVCGRKTTQYLLVCDGQTGLWQISRAA